MATYTVHMSNVQEVAAQMGVIAGKIQSMLSDLDDASKQHLSEWTADSQQAYYAAKAVWDQKAADMAVQAQNAQNSLTNITDAYANAEYQGLGLWEQ
jgi:WXG100 family type VII secretion target